MLLLSACGGAATPPTATLTLTRGTTGSIAGLSVRYVDTGFAETSEGCFQFHQLVVSEGAQREEHTVRTGEVLAVMGRNLTVTGNAEQIVLEAR